MKNSFTATATSDRHIMSQRVLRVLRNQKMEYIIRHHYGMFDSKPREFDQIAIDLKISETYVRQLHEKSLRKLRFYVRSVPYIQEYF